LIPNSPDQCFLGKHLAAIHWLKLKQEHDNFKQNN